MDLRSEDTIVRQIEQNLSNNMNDNLFQTGRATPTSRAITRKNQVTDKSEEALAFGEASQEVPLVSYDYINNSQGLTRAEYIRQAREACLRQLSATQIYSRPYDVNYIDPEEASSEQLDQKKAKVMRMFHNGLEDENIKEKVNSNPRINAYRSVIIRSVCAVALFLTIFVIDKYDIQIGNITNKMIQEYVMGNDALKDLENILVTWLK